MIHIRPTVHQVAVIPPLSFPSSFAASPRVQIKLGGDEEPGRCRHIDVENNEVHCKLRPVERMRERRRRIRSRGDEEQDNCEEE